MFFATQVYATAISINKRILESKGFTSWIFAQNIRELVECDETVRISYVIRKISHEYDRDCVIEDFKF